MEIVLILIIFPALKLLTSQNEADAIRGIFLTFLFLIVSLITFSEYLGSKTIHNDFLPLILIMIIPILLRLYNLYSEQRVEK